MARTRIAAALAGLLPAADPTLYKRGYLGVLPCGTGGGDVVQASTALTTPIFLLALPGLRRAR